MKLHLISKYGKVYTIGVNDIIVLDKPKLLCGTSYWKCVHRLDCGEIGFTRFPLSTLNNPMYIVIWNGYNHA